MSEIKDSNDQIFSILFENDEITWQQMIYDLVSSEKMDPWDVDVSMLAAKFLDRLKELKQMDLKISGKVLLAAAILLRVKSTRFMEDDIGALDALISSASSEDDGLFEELIEGEDGQPISLEGRPKIFPRTPQPRKRKVSVFDLVNALEKALEVYKRRPAKLDIRPDVKAPEKPRDISLVIKDVYVRITAFFNKKGEKPPRLTFNLLLPKDTKEDKILTFVPLLHLDFQRKIDLNQDQHFGEIYVELLAKE
jgi:segregation and condensation protein A